MDDIARGRVIWLDVTDPQGNAAGEHAAVILTTKDEYEAGKPIIAVVISSKLHHAPKDRMVMLPWQRGGHPRTGLSMRCAAMCDWLVTVNEDHINSYGGRVFGKWLEEIIIKVTNPP